MKNLTIEDIIDLVVADVPEPVSNIQRIFEWHFDRIKSTATWVLGVATTIFVALIVSYFTETLPLSWQLALTMIVLPLGVASFGIYQLIQLRTVHRQFIATLKLHKELSPMRTFFRRYRSNEGKI